MITNNIILYSAKILTEFFLKFVYFPFWWYFGGLILLIKALLRFLLNRQKSLALFVWIKNIFKPMYGQYDWQGVLISIIVRIFQIIIRGIIMIFWIALSGAIFLFWLALPPLIVYEIIYQII